jgi:hypothetical protein
LLLFDYNRYICLALSLGHLNNQMIDIQGVINHDANRLKSLFNELSVSNTVVANDIKTSSTSLTKDRVKVMLTMIKNDRNTGSSSSASSGEGMALRSASFVCGAFTRLDFNTIVNILLYVDNGRAHCGRVNILVMLLIVI